jgi:hypothetical protein
MLSRRCLDARLVLKEARVQIDSHNAPISPDLVTEPARDRTAARTDIETAPARADTKSLKPRGCDRVIYALD